MTADEHARRKLDASARALLAGTAIDDDPGALRVLVRGREPFTDRHVDELRRAGVRVGTVAGDVLTASVDRAGLERLVASALVVRIELSTPLDPEVSDDPGTPPPDDGPPTDR